MTNHSHGIGALRSCSPKKQSVVPLIEQGMSIGVYIFVSVSESTIQFVVESKRKVTLARKRDCTASRDVSLLARKWSEFVYV